MNGTEDTQITIQCPDVTVAATDPDAAEAGPDSGIFTVSRSGDTTSALTVNFTVSGTATNSTDYNTISSPVTIQAGQANATVTVTPVADGAVEPSETVILALASGTGYSVGNPDSATVTITDAPALQCAGLTPTIVGTSSSDTIPGTSGNDVIHGLGGNDTINGGNGIDRLFGENGNDALNGNNGNDALDGGADTDTCNGGNGSDTAASCESVTGVP